MDGCGWGAKLAAAVSLDAQGHHHHHGTRTTRMGGSPSSSPNPSTMKLRDDLERLKKISDALDFIRAADDKGFMANQGAWCSQATNGGCSTSATQTTTELQVYEI